jgi:hypothetical protein
MIICADDYGLREDIDRAILELCSLEKLSAVSCMVTLARFDGELAMPLLEHQNRIDIGLHFCLTDEGLPLSSPESESFTFGNLIWRSFSNQLNPAVVFRQVANQYELFLRKFGRPPDHIDGHLHVHQLPPVRSGLVEFILTLPPDSRPYIRNTAASLGGIRSAGLPWMKAGIIGALGGRMKRVLEEAKISTNSGFTGIYDFQDWPMYSSYFEKFAGCLSDPDGMLVVHPGMDEDWRRSEYETLRQRAFSGFSLNRFRKVCVSSSVP